MRAILVCALALAVGCGGGGGTSMATAQLAGTVYEVDGQSASLGGVPVVLKETGEWTWTDASGSFEFDGLEGGTYTLDFMGDSEGASGDGDEFADGDGDPKVDVPDGGRVECDVALEDGKVKDFSSSDEEEGLYAMARLHMTDAGWLEGFRLEGGIKIAAWGDGTLFKVCIEGFEEQTQIDIFVGEVFLGAATAVEGRACLVLENEFSIDALRELAGLRVDVYLNDSDLRLMVGEVPSLKEHEEDGDDKPDGGDDEPGDKPDEGDGDDGYEGDDKPNEDGTAGEGEGDGKDGEECEEPKEDGEGDGEEPGEGDGEGGTDGEEK